MYVCVCVFVIEGGKDKDRERTERSWESAAVEVDYEVVKTLCLLLFERETLNSFVLY